MSFTKEQLETMAAGLERQEKPSHMIYDAVRAVYGDDVTVHEHYDDYWIENGESRLYYVIEMEEGDPTIMVIEPDQGDLIVVVGDRRAVQKERDLAYAAKHGGAICAACGEMEHKECVECPRCGKYMDGTDCPELTLPEELGKCLEDGGSERYVWLLKERLPTHETKANHSYMFIQMDLMPDEDRHSRSKFDKPKLWNIDIRIVNVGSAGKAGAESVCSSFGWDELQWKELNHEGKAQALSDNGIAAVVWQESGYSPRRLLDLALAEVPKVSMLTGFYLDKQMNALGSTGWDFMKGDALAGLNRFKKAQKTKAE